VEKPGQEKPLRCRLKWENNIKIDLHEVGWEVDWIELALNREKWLAVWDSVMNLHFP
jgi:hypothetical protein